MQMTFWEGFWKVLIPAWNALARRFEVLANVLRTGHIGPGWGGKRETRLLPDFRQGDRIREAFIPVSGPAGPLRVRLSLRGAPGLPHLGNENEGITVGTAPHRLKNGHIGRGTGEYDLVKPCKRHLLAAVVYNVGCRHEIDLVSQQCRCPYSRAISTPRLGQWLSSSVPHPRRVAQSPCHLAAAPPAPRTPAR